MRALEEQKLKLNQKSCFLVNMEGVGINTCFYRS